MEQKTTEERLALLELRLQQQTMLEDMRAKRLEKLQERVTKLEVASAALRVVTDAGMLLRFSDAQGAVRLEVGIDAQGCPVVKATGPDGGVLLGVTPEGTPHLTVGRRGRVGVCVTAEEDGSAHLALNSYGGV